MFGRLFPFPQKLFRLPADSSDEPLDHFPFPASVHPRTAAKTTASFDMIPHHESRFLGRTQIDNSKRNFLMNKLKWLTGSDQRASFWVHYNYDPQRGVTLRPEFVDLVCSNPKCRKLNDLEAIDRGVKWEPGTKFKSMTDWFNTSDARTLVSHRFLEVCRKEGIHGFSIRQIGLEDFVLLTDGDHCAAFDQATCGMQFLRPCTTCGRFRETVLLPSSKSLQTTLDDLEILSVTPRFEGVNGRRDFFLTTSTVQKILKSQKLKGIDFSDCH